MPNPFTITIRGTLEDGAAGSDLDALALAAHVQVEDPEDIASRDVETSAHFLADLSPTSRALDALRRYDEIVRENFSPMWDTIRAVSECRDGVWGAFGELLDTAGPDLPDTAADLLADLFQVYQAALASEVANRPTDPPRPIAYEARCPKCGETFNPHAPTVRPMHTQTADGSDCEGRGEPTGSYR